MTKAQKIVSQKCIQNVLRVVKWAHMANDGYFFLMTRSLIALVVLYLLTELWTNGVSNIIKYFLPDH